MIDHIVIDLAKFSLIATLPTDQVASSLASSEKAQIAAWCLFKVGPPRPRTRRVKRGRSSDRRGRCDSLRGQKRSVVRCLLQVARRHGDQLREGWHNVLECVLKLHRARLCTELLDNVGIQVRLHVARSAGPARCVSTPASNGIGPTRPLALTGEYSPRPNHRRCSVRPVPCQEIALGSDAPPTITTPLKGRAVSLAFAAHTGSDTNDEAEVRELAAQCVHTCQVRCGCLSNRTNGKGQTVAYAALYCASLGGA